MRTIRGVLAVLAVLHLTLESCQAFYNPSTGRWLNRDPAGETGFRLAGETLDPGVHQRELNQQAFVLNATIIYVDRLGLNCTCGPDITEALAATLGQVEQEFNSLSLLGKAMACAAVAGVGANPENAWDINTLAYTSPNYPADKTGYQDPLEKGETSHCCSFYSCRETVVIAGKCVHSHQATYVLLGKIAGLCGVPIGSVHPIIDDWKKQRYPNANAIYTDQAHALTDYGNRGSFPGDFEGLDACFIKPGHKTQLPNFTWTWEPFHPRTQN